MPNRHSIAAAVFVLAAAGAATAQETLPDTWQRLASTLSRAEVRAAAVASRRDPGGVDAYLQTWWPRLLRTQVSGDLAEARTSGELAAINAPVYVPARLPPHAAPRADAPTR